MERYADRAIDLAAASLITVGEILATTRIFAVDRRDFGTCRIRRGHRPTRVDIGG